MTESIPSLENEIRQLYCGKGLTPEHVAEHIKIQHNFVVSKSSLEQTFHRLGLRKNAGSDVWIWIDHRLRERETMETASALNIRGSTISIQKIGKEINQRVSTSRQTQHESVATPKTPDASDALTPEDIPSPTSTIRAESEPPSDPYPIYQVIPNNEEYVSVPQYPLEHQMPQELEAIELIFWSKDLAASSVLPPWWWWGSVPPTWQPYQERYSAMARQITSYNSKPTYELWSDPALAITVDFLISAYRNRAQELRTLFTSCSTLYSPYILNAALMLASRTNSLEAAVVLLSFGASPIGRDIRGLTALHVAAEKNYPLLLRMLVSTGANVNCKSKSGDTPWSLVSGSPQHDQVAKILISVGAHRDVCVRDGMPDCLLGTSCDVKYTFDNVIYNLSGQYNIDNIRTMLERGVDPNVQCCRGRYPLDVAVSGGHVDVVKLLVESGAEVNCGWQWHRTPLDITYEGRQINAGQIRQFLVEHGAMRGQDIEANNIEDTMAP